MKLISQTIGKSQCWKSGEDECFMPMIRNNIYVISDTSIFCCLLRIILYCIDNSGCFLLIGKALYCEVNKIIASGSILRDLCELEFTSELLSSIESLQSTEHERAPGWLVFEALFQYIDGRMVGGRVVGEFVDLYSISLDRATSEYGNTWNDKERSTLFSASRKKVVLLEPWRRANGISWRIRRFAWRVLSCSVYDIITFLFSNI